MRAARCEAAVKTFPVEPIFYSIGNFSEFSYRIKTLRGMRTTRIRKMAAVVAALRRECASRRTLFCRFLRML